MNFCFESLLEGMPLLAYPRLFFGKGKTSAARQFGEIALLKGQFVIKLHFAKCNSVPIWRYG